MSMQNIMIIKQWTFLEKYYLKVLLCKKLVYKLASSISFQIIVDKLCDIG